MALGVALSRINPGEAELSLTVRADTPARRRRSWRCHRCAWAPLSAGRL